MLLIVYLLQCAFLYNATMGSKVDHAYVVGLLKEPLYNKVDNDPKLLPNTSTGNHSLRIKIRNPGSVSENVGFNLYLPDSADVMSFSVSIFGTSYKAMKSDRKRATMIMKKATTEDHNAAVYVPKQMSDLYGEDTQSLASTVHIKGRHDITFDLLYKEDISNIIKEGKKALNRARINLDLYGTSVEDMSAELTSPNYPDSYPNSADVAWWVRVPDGKAVSLQVNELDIEECCDRLMIYDGASRHDNIIAEITGRIEDLTSATYQTSTNSMFLRLVSDCSETFTGFKITTSTVVIVTSPTPPITTTPSFINSTDFSFQCTGTNYLYAYPESFNSFSSPGYPNSYYDNLNCVWSIQTYFNYVVRLVVIDMYLDGGNDYVDVYDGSSSNFSLIAILKGTDFADLYSSGNYMYVNFVTDHSVTRRGFNFSYSASYNSETTTANHPETTPQNNSTCGEHIDLYPSSGYGYIYSPNYPYYYYSNTKCNWYIYCHYTDYVVMLYISTMHLGYGDGVSFYDGFSYELLRNFSSVYASNLAIYSNSQSMEIRFVSDEKYQAQGFQFQYLAHYSTSPTTIAEEVTTSVNGSSVCNGVKELYAYTGQSHNFSSFGYPSNYYNYMDCEWRIYANYYDYVIQLHVDDMDLESCCDSVQLYDGYSSSSRLIATLSGTRKDETYSSSVAYMSVKFRTDGSVTRKGFQLSYEAAPALKTTNSYPDNATSYIERCTEGKTLTIYDDGYLSSPNYPDNYYSNARCSWTLTTSNYDYVVRIDFNYLSLERYDELEIYDGPSQYYNRLAKLMYNSSVSGYFHSSGRSMFITFTSDDYYESDGFNIHYYPVYRPVFEETTNSILTSAAQGETCTLGNILYLEFGNDYYISSPNYPEYYNSNARCSWLISVSDSFQIVAYVSHLSLAPNDEVVIYNGSSDDYRVLAHLFYNSPKPGNIFSSGQHMYITFTSDNNSESTGFRIECSALY